MIPDLRLGSHRPPRRSPSSIFETLPPFNYLALVHMRLLYYGHIDSIQGSGEENNDHAASVGEIGRGCFRRLLSQKRELNVVPTRIIQVQTLQRCVFIHPMHHHPPSSGSSAYANAFRCSNVHDDLLTCFIIRGVPGYLFSHNPQDQNTPHTHVVHPQFSHLLTKPQPSVFPSAARYAKDPVFNIVLPERSPSTILSTGKC